MRDGSHPLIINHSRPQQQLTRMHQTDSNSPDSCTVIDMRSVSSSTSVQPEADNNCVSLDTLIDDLVLERRDEIVTPNGARIRLDHPYLRDYRQRSRRKHPTQSTYPSHNALSDCTCLATCCQISTVGLTTRIATSRWRILRRCCAGLNNPNRYWLVQDACGISALVITWILIVFALSALNVLVLVPAIMNLENGIVLPSINLSIFHMIAFLAIYSHIRASFTNPGAIRISNCTPELVATLRDGEIVKLCGVCRSLKLDRSHHCSLCNRCIRKMDHHCPWINNCVGQGNQKFFILFTFYICLMSFYSLGLVAYKIYQCSRNDWAGCEWNPSSQTFPASFILIIIVGFESVLFGFFTLIMTCSQLFAVCNDETSIEVLKREQQPFKRTWTDNLRLVFASSPSSKRFSLTWCSPFHSPSYGSSSLALNEDNTNSIAGQHSPIPLAFDAS
ncbi:hypothetical protein ACOME3_007894 [Neoechinorhynchus agilis]